MVGETINSHKTPFTPDNVVKCKAQRNPILYRCINNEGTHL